MNRHIFCNDRVKSKPEICVSSAHVDSIFLAMSKNTEIFIQILRFFEIKTSAKKSQRFDLSEVIFK